MESFQKKEIKIEKKDFTYKDIDELYGLSKELFTDKKKIGDYIEKETLNISNILHEKLGSDYLGSFGLGYPFYAKNGYEHKEGINDKEKLLQIKEIDRFIDEKKEALKKEDFENSWSCLDCEENNSKIGLRELCKDCSKTSIKFRQVLKTLPDIDQLIVVDHVDSEVLLKIEKSLKENGYTQSDISIRDALENTKAVLIALKNDSDIDKKLPVDIHVIDFQKFLLSMEKIRLGNKIEVKTDSLHAIWGKYDLPLWFDFIFSAKEVGFLDEKLKEQTNFTRKYISENQNIDTLVSDIKNSSERAKRIFATSTVEDNLRGKIESWKYEKN